MPTFKPNHAARAWALLMSPALSFLVIGLFLHPMAPEDALVLLASDAFGFLFRAGPTACNMVLAGAVLLLASCIGLGLALFRGNSRRLGYHAGMIKSTKRSRLSLS